MKNKYTQMINASKAEKSKRVIKIGNPYSPILTYLNNQTEYSKEWDMIELYTQD